MQANAAAADWVVLKFGGTSVSSIERWRIIAETLRARLDEGLQPLVVCSALAGESDLLEQLLAAAENGSDIRPALAEVARTHRALAADMGLDVREVIGDLLEELERLATGAHMLEEASPRIRARIMSMGELMSTRLGAAWLTERGIRTSWQDARELLRADTNPLIMANAPARHYLSATCAYDRDPELGHRLTGAGAEVVITQGFIAGDADGDTVLLGRGGSDTSAAYFAARLGARRLEIWTDVPGMFTANPRLIPEARLLRRLRYQEAEELALMGGRVLHPRCIAPVAAHHIPLHIKCTLAPEMIGTVITSGIQEGPPRVKAVSLRKGMWLFNVHPDRALQNVGFLESCAGCFTRWNLSVDMVAASETTITFSLDSSSNHLDDAVIAGVLSELRALAPCRVVGPAAALSLVGTRIPGVLHELGQIFEFFENHEVHLVSQAADALNFTVVIGETDADVLIAGLHSRLFPADLRDPAFGPPWNQLFS